MMDNNDNDNDNINQNNNHNNNFRGNQNQNERRNEIIRVVQSENNRIGDNHNNYERQNYNIGENYYYGHPNRNLICDCSCQKFCYFWLIFLFFVLGICIVGLNHRNSFFCLIGIFNFLLFILILVFFFEKSCFELVSKFDYLVIYLFVLFVATGHAFSFYIGIFHNCVTFNPNKPKLLQKEIIIISLIYNIFIGGAGTLLYGLSKIWEKNLYD
jgi:hypothetical protein